MSARPARLRRLRRRRWAFLLATAAVLVGLPLVFGHRGEHASLLLPGAGLYGEHLAAGLALTALSVAASIAWLRCGTDWAVALAALTAVATSATWMSPEAGSPEATRMSHEFPLVVLVLIVLGSLRHVAVQTPVGRRIAAARRRRPKDLESLPPVARCRTVAVLALAGVADERAAEAADADDVRRRARRIGIVARGRWTGDPLRGDHAHARAALALCERLDEAARARLVRDAGRSWAGVPCSEPGWVRPIDGTLVALALRDDPDVGQKWADALRYVLPLGRGHRPAWVWTPLGVAAGHAPDWEHAAATALGRAAGWIEHDDDWRCLRQRALGAAARGTDVVDDERLVAAARCWLVFVDDPVAAQVLARPTVRHDPLAIALDALATRLRTDATALLAAR